MSVTNRPSRSGPTRHWLDYLDALRDALAAASAQDTLAVRFEVTIAEDELVRRGLPLRALKLPDRRPEPPETFSPRPCASPEAQRLWGEALVKVGRKYRDERSIRLGWAELRATREQNRGEPEGLGEERMKLPDDCPHALTPPWQQMLSEPTGTTRCCLADGRTLMLGNEEPLCRTIQSESEVYRFVWRSSFNGNAVVRIHRQGDAITLGW